MNASMMYLVVKICSEHSHRSCGCHGNQRYSEAVLNESSIPNAIQEFSFMKEDGDSFTPSFSIDHATISQNDVRRLEAGSPVRLIKSMIRRQGKISSSIVHPLHDTHKNKSNHFRFTRLFG